MGKKNIIVAVYPLSSTTTMMSFIDSFISHLLAMMRAFFGESMAICVLITLGIIVGVGIPIFQLFPRSGAVSRRLGRHDPCGKCDTDSEITECGFLEARLKSPTLDKHELKKLLASKVSADVREYVFGKGVVEELRFSDCMEHLCKHKELFIYTNLTVTDYLALPAYKWFAGRRRALLFHEKHDMESVVEMIRSRNATERARMPPSRH
jgi:hypothetical protein